MDVKRERFGIVLLNHNATVLAEDNETRTNNNRTFFPLMHYSMLEAMKNVFLI